jgi:hypothetical protein
VVNLVCFSIKYTTFFEYTMCHWRLAKRQQTKKKHGNTKRLFNTSTKNTDISEFFDGVAERFMPRQAGRYMPPQVVVGFGCAAFHCSRNKSSPLNSCVSNLVQVRHEVHKKNSKKPVHASCLVMLLACYTLCMSLNVRSKQSWSFDPRRLFFFALHKKKMHRWLLYKKTSDFDHATAVKHC